MIDGVTVTPLRKIPDERGYVMHFLRNDSPVFRQFGEVYFSAVYPGVVKGWHLHNETTLTYAVVRGSAKVVLYDERPGSSTCGELMELFIGDQNYQLVTVPPGLWNGFKGIGVSESLVAVFMDQPYRADEITRLDPFSDRIPYDWSLKNE